MFKMLLTACSSFKPAAREITGSRFIVSEAHGAPETKPCSKKDSCEPARRPSMISKECSKPPARLAMLHPRTLARVRPATSTRRSKNPANRQRAVPAAGLDPNAKERYVLTLRIILTSVLTCPECGHQCEETMPLDSCQYFYECRFCKTLIKPKPGDCCVFCSYGAVKCPPKQKAMR